MKSPRFISVLAVGFAASLLGACASTQSCNASADYRKAAAIPPIKAAEGLQLPESPSALRVPELTPVAKQAAETEPMPKKGRGTACLDYPPEIVVSDAASKDAKR